MKSQPLVTIIINNYNYEQFLSEAIDSAINQTYEWLEIIVVDDASADNSCEVIASYGDKIKSIFRQKNGKQAAALNDGFAASEGEIVIFLDADDYLFPQAVKCILDVWQLGISKVHYRLEVVDGNRQPLGYTYPQGSKPLAKGEVWRELLESGGYAGTSMSGNAINRQALERVFPIPDEYKLTADDYLSTLIPFHGDVIAIEESLAAYRIHYNNQWALNTVTGDRFLRFVKHDLQNYELIVKKARELNYEIPKDLERRSIGRLWSRIISLRLNGRKHPIAQDNCFSLIYQGIDSLWRYSHLNWQKRLVYSFWFIWVGLLPLFLAKPAMTWLYAPQFRPQIIAWTIKKVRLLVD